MDIESIDGEKLRLLADNDRGIGEYSEHIVLRVSAMDLLARAACGRNVLLSRRQSSALAHYLLRSNAEDASFDTAPVVDQEELAAFMIALMISAEIENEKFASLASTMLEQIRIEDIVQYEVGELPDDLSSLTP